MDKIIFSLRNCEALAQKISQSPNIQKGRVQISRFCDQEVSIQLLDSVEGKDAIVIGSTQPPAENLFELLSLINTLKINGTKEIEVIIPYFGYGRSDHQYQEGTPINARLIAGFIEKAGAQKITVVTFHSNLIEKFFEIPINHLSSAQIFADYLKSKKIKNIAIASPDLGGIERAKDLAKLMDTKEIIQIEKVRPTIEEAKVVRIEGNAENKTVVIIDDMVQSGGTAIKATQALKRHGAKKIILAVTHLVNTGPAIDKLCDENDIDDIITTNSISQIHSHLCKKIKILDISDLLLENL